MLFSQEVGFRQRPVDDWPLLEFSSREVLLSPPLIKCNSGSRVDTVAAVQQMALVTSEPLPWVNKP